MSYRTLLVFVAQVLVTMGSAHASLPAAPLNESPAAQSVASGDDRAYVLSADLQIEKFDIEDDTDREDLNADTTIADLTIPSIIDQAEDHGAPEEMNSSVVLPAGSRFVFTDGVIDQNDGARYVRVQVDGGFQFWTRLEAFDQASYIGEAEVAGGRAGATSSRVGWRKMNGKIRCHEGTDITYPVGTPIGARAGSGVVTYAGWMNGYGKVVEMSHPGNMMSRYGHLSSIAVKVGQHVAAGQNIGRSGATGRVTGPHLHYEYKKVGTSKCGGSSKNAQLGIGKSGRRHNRRK